MQQLFKLALFELGIVSDLVECVHLHNLAVLEDRVQQVLEESQKIRRLKRGENFNVLQQLFSTFKEAVFQETVRLPIDLCVLLTNVKYL